MEKHHDLEVPKSLDEWFYGYLDERKKEADRLERKKYITKIQKIFKACTVRASEIWSTLLFGVQYTEWTLCKSVQHFII